MTLGTHILDEHEATMQEISEEEAFIDRRETAALLMIAERLERLGEMIEDRLLKIESRL